MLHFLMFLTACFGDVSTSHPEIIDSTFILYDTCITNDGAIIAGGEQKHVGAVLLKSSDSGVTWHKVVLKGYEAVIRADFIDHRHGWCLTSTHDLLSSFDGGKTWKVSNLPDSVQPLDIAFSTPRDGVCLTRDGQNCVVYISADAGATWKSQRIWEDKMFRHYKVSLVAPGTFALVLSDGVYLSHGDDWLKKTPFRAVDCSLPDGKSAWALKEALFDSNILMSSLDKGISWQKYNQVPRPLHAQAVAFSNANLGWVLSESDFGAWCICRVSEGGKSLEPQEWLTAGKKPLSLSASEAGLAVCAGKGELRVYRESKWEDVSQCMTESEDQRPRDPSSNIEDFSLISQDEAVILRGDRCLFVTDNRGSTWKSHQLPFDGSSISFLSPELGFCVTRDEMAFGTQDGGNTWFRQAPIVSLRVSQCFFGDQDQGFIRGLKPTYLKSSDGIIFPAGSEEVCLQTLNRGMEWNVTKACPGMDRVNGTPCSWRIDPLGAGMRVTGDFGATWKDFSQGFGFAGWMSSEDVGWCSEYSEIRRTIDGGKTWVPSQYPASMNASSICFVSDTNGWCCGTDVEFEQSILATYDSGKSWQRAFGEGVRMPTDGFAPVRLTKIRFANNLVGWCVGTNGTVLKTEDGGANWKRIELP